MVSAVRPLDDTELEHPPFVLRWSEPHNPLPVKVIQSPGPNGHPLSFSPPWIISGPLGEPFNFCRHLKILCQDIVENCPELSHIQTEKLLFATLQARNGHSHGLQARVTPLRFPGGKVSSKRRGTKYQVQRLFHGKLEFLYLVTFCLPRFLNQDFDNKLITLFHELYHISPEFDGDLRRYKGRYALHSYSKKNYDEHMAGLAREYLQHRSDSKLHDFLRLDFRQLEQRHGCIQGVMVPRPKIIPIV